MWCWRRGGGCKLIRYLLWISLRPVTPSTSSAKNPFICDVLHLTQDVYPVLFQCWASVEDDGTTLKQQCFTFSSVSNTAPTFNVGTTPAQCFQNKPGIVTAFARHCASSRLVLPVSWSVTHAQNENVRYIYTNRAWFTSGWSAVRCPDD